MNKFNRKFRFEAKISLRNIPFLSRVTLVLENLSLDFEKLSLFELLFEKRENMYIKNMNER